MAVHVFLCFCVPMCMCLGSCAGVALVGYSDSAAKASKSDKGVTLDLGVLYSLIGALL